MAELLENAGSAHGEVVLVRENEVVGEDDVYAGECELDLLGCLNVLPRGRAVAAWVVVREVNGIGVVQKAQPGDLARRARSPR